MCDNTLVRFVDKHGKTCVFWDVNDYPIPYGLDPASIYQSIKDAIKKHGCDAEVVIHAYADDNTVSDDLRRQLLDAGFKFEVFSPDKQIWPGAPLFTSIFDGGRNNISGSSQRKRKLVGDIHTASIDD